MDFQHQIPACAEYRAAEFNVGHDAEEMNTQESNSLPRVTLRQQVRVTPRWQTNLVFFATKSVPALGFIWAIVLKDWPPIPFDEYAAGGNPVLARIIIRLIWAASATVMVSLSVKTIFVIGIRNFVRGFSNNVALSFRSWKALKVYGHAALVIYIGLAAYFFFPYGAYWLSASIAASLLPVFYTMMPPIALVLGASQTHAGSAYAVAYRSSRPLKLAYLLRDDCMPSSTMDIGLPQQSYRTYSIEEWQAQVESLIDSVPVVVFDLRTPTPHVSTELAMVGRHLHGRVVVLVEEDAHPDLGPMYHKISEQALASVKSDAELEVLMKFLWNAFYGLDKVTLGWQ